MINLFLSIITEIIKGLLVGTGSYGNKTFPDPLEKEEEETKYIGLNNLKMSLILCINDIFSCLNEFI